MEFLVRTHQLRALRVAYLITGDRMTAEDAVQEATVQEVREALWRLSPEQRASLVLRYYGDMSVEEIAGMTDVPPGTVKLRLYEGRRRLRQALRWPERLSSGR